MTDWLVPPGHGMAVATSDLPAAALEGVPDVRRAVLPWKGQQIPLTAFPCPPEVWGRLRQRGMLVPPVMDAFEFPGVLEPMAHQRSTVEFLVQHERAFCLNGLRTGKTISTLWAAEYLRQAGLVRRVLVVAVVFICDIVWERAIFVNLPHVRAITLRGDRDRKRRMAMDTRFEYIVVNPESLHLVADHLPDVDLVVVDEFTRFKNVRVGSGISRRYAALRHVARGKRLWMLSGTPHPQSPLDAYGPVKLVRPDLPLTFTAFREETMTKVSQFKWVPKAGVKEALAGLLQPAIRFKREDCIDIPDVEVGELKVELTKQQSRVIQELADKAASVIEDGVLVDAPHAAAAMVKSLQVMAGGVYGDDPSGERATHKVDASPTLDAIASTVREANAPVLVFANFQCSVDIIAEHLHKAGYRTGKRTRGQSEVLGQGRTKSMELFDAFQNGGLDVLVAIPQTMQFGLELTRGNLVLWASPPFSFEVYEQANARVQGASQKSKVMILHLVQNALAIDLFRRLQSREALQTAVLTLIEQGGSGCQ